MAVIGRRKVLFELKYDVELGRTVDCSTFMIQEMRLDLSSKWFDYKVRVAASSALSIMVCVFLIRIMSVVLIQLTFLIYLQETTLPPNPRN